VVLSVVIKKEELQGMRVDNRKGKGTGRRGSREGEGIMFKQKRNRIGEKDFILNN
jgi:hypothetical protein